MLRSFFSVLLFTSFSMSQPGPMLFDFEAGFGAGTVSTFGATSALETINGNQGWVITPSAGSGWKGATLTFAAKDLSGYQGVILAIHNPNKVGMAFFADIDNDKAYPTNTGYAYVEPGETDTLYVHFSRNTLPTYMANYLKGMKGMPGGYTEHWEVIDPTRVTQIQISRRNPEAGLGFVIDNIRPWAIYALPTEAELQSGFFPILDSLGQYRHQAWPGKASSSADILAQAKAEAVDLQNHPGEKSWDEYGGWATGPMLTATGNFRTEKVSGKWWLVDPNGRLFWSQGITCVGNYESTPTAGRTNYFSVMPADGNFRGANAKLKFGTDWTTQANALAHQRLRSWGMNTIGNWSDKGIYSQKKTAYTVNFSSGITKTVPSTIDTVALRANARKAIATLKLQIDKDPFCIGIFSDNELDWPAAALSTVVAEDYYRICSQEVHAALPNLLYLGSRIHSAPEPVWRAAGKYCDVISHNHYAYSLIDIPLPADIDKPVMITEYHFGALDRGLAHPGLRGVFNQRQRARAFSDFVTQGIRDPRIVGAHWFQYGDQVYTGRTDGENYQIGFVDVADRPYPEMVATSRGLGANMYLLRSDGAVGDVQRTYVPSAKLPSSKKPVDLLGRVKYSLTHFSWLFERPARP
jgi:hypothetical protein